MQFNNSTDTYLSLYHNTLFSLGIDRNDTTTYPIADFTRNANNWYRRVNAWIWQVTGEWEYDDSNYTNLPEATADLVNGQRDYELPSTAQKIDRVEVLDNLGNSQKLEAIDKSQITISMDEFEKTAGMPKYYDVLGRSLLLYPAPSSSNTTLSNGIKLYFSRDINEFQTTDTSASPGFIEDFHEMISVGAAIDFAETVGDYNRSTTLNNRMKSLKEDLVKYYGSNQRDLMPSIAPNYIRHK